MTLCACGCGNALPKPKRLKNGKAPIFLKGHNAIYRVKHGMEPISKKGYEPLREPVKQKEKPEPVYLKGLTDEQISYIKGHYKRVKRSELAKRVGLHKVIFNMVCIELGLRKVEA